MRGLFEWWERRKCVKAGGTYANKKCCCGKDVFSPDTKCCRDGITYGKDGEIVATKYMIYTSSGLQGGMNRRLAHYWLEWGTSERVESNAANDGKGYVEYTDKRVESIKDPSSINQYTPPVATPIKLSVCDGYDLSAFTSCLSKKAKKDNHAYSGKLCHEYIDEIIDACKKEQKK